MGTLGYMSPEQIRGDLKQIGPSCDIYALGVMLYELLTGRLPFIGSELAVAAQILTEAPLPPSRHRSDLAPALEAICLKAMAKAIGDRYFSMAELAAALTGFLHSPSASPTPTSSVGSPASPSPTSGERPRPVGSDSLVGQFLDQLAQHKETPFPIRTAEPVALRPPPPERRRPRWPLIVAACVLGVIMLSGIIYVVTDKGRIKITVDGPTLAIKIDHDEVRIDGLGEPITLRSGEHNLTVIRGNTETETRKFIVRRWHDEALRIEYVPRSEEMEPSDTEKVADQSPLEKEKPADTEKVAGLNPPVEEKSVSTEDVAESNPWPQALAPAGHVLPLWERILAMSPDCRRLAVATRTDMKIVVAPDASKVFEMKGQPPPQGGNAPYIWAVAFSPDGKYIAVSLHEFSRQDLGDCERQRSTQDRFISRNVPRL